MKLSHLILASGGAIAAVAAQNPDVSLMFENPPDAIEGCPITEGGHHPQGWCCPQGWTCTGAAATNDHPGRNNAGAGNLQGTQFFEVGSDGSTGTGTSNAFVLPAGTTKVKFKRAGGADNGGLRVYRVSDNAMLCELKDGTNTDSMVENECNIGSGHEGELVYLYVWDCQNSGWGKTYIDDIRFANAAGASTFTGATISATQIANSHTISCDGAPVVIAPAIPDTSSPTSSPTSTPTTSAPTTAPTQAPTVPGPIGALNLTAVTSDFLTKSAVSLVYDSGVGRAFRYELFKKGCDVAVNDTSLVVATHDVQPKDDSDSLQEVTLTYDFNLTAVENSDIYNSTSTTLEVCSKMEIMVGEIPVYTTEQEIIMDFNLVADFSLNVTLEEALTKTANDTVDYQNAIRGFKCNTATFDSDPTELAPNEELDICIESTDTSVLIEELVTLKSKQGEGDDVLIVSEGSAEVAAITTVDPPRGPTAQMTVSTRLPINMFTFAVGEELTVSGSVLLQFASRRLQSDRKLRNLQDSVTDAEPQEAAFQVKVDLKRENGVGDEVPMGSSAGYATSKYAAAFGLISMVILNLM